MPGSKLLCGSRVRLRINTAGPRDARTGDPMTRYGAPPHDSRGVVVWIGPRDPQIPLAGRLLGVALDNGREVWVMEAEVRLLSGDGM